MYPFSSSTGTKIREIFLGPDPDPDIFGKVGFVTGMKKYPDLEYLEYHKLLYVELIKMSYDYFSLI